LEGLKGGMSDMSLEELREYVKKSKFYYFITKEDFEKRIDYDGKSVKHILFERGLVDEGIDNVPTRYSAYGTKRGNSK
jgi:hypothetical protein